MAEAPPAPGSGNAPDIGTTPAVAAPSAEDATPAVAAPSAEDATPVVAAPSAEDATAPGAGCRTEPKAAALFPAGLPKRGDFFDDSDLTDFFDAAARDLCGKLHVMFKEKMDAFRAKLRLEYDEAAKQARENAKQQLSDLVKQFRLPVGSGAGAVRSNAAGSELATTVAEEAVRLELQLSELREAQRPLLDCQEWLPYEQATSCALNGVISGCNKLNKYSTDCLDRLSLQLDVQSISGEEYRVEVHPQVDRVANVISKLIKKHNLEGRSIDLCLSNGIRLRRKDTIGDYDLSVGVVMGMEDMLLTDLLVRVRFDRGSPLGIEEVSGQQGHFTQDDGYETVDVEGREGVRFFDRCSFRLPEPVDMGADWTIATWTLAPVGTNQGYRVLVDGTTHESLIVFTFRRSLIGFYDRRVSTIEDFDLNTLSEGWHHLAAVRAEHQITYYVDGRAVGCLECDLEGQLATLGNSAAASSREAFGVISDFRLYGAAASAEQVRMLADAV